MTNLEATVRSIVEDFMDNGILFTALDVSNAVKQSLPFSKHREVRDAVRGMFATHIETQNWARTPITVTLKDGSTAEALLYHPVSDSWDLDNKYSAQQRQAASYSPTPTQNASSQVVSTPVSVPVVPATITTVPMPTARTLWDQMFQTQPSLFPGK